MEDSEPPSPALPGFEFVDAPAEFRDPAARVVRIPRGIRSKRKLLVILADKLKFPGYFGNNWDALEECLQDLSWLPTDQSVALVHLDLPFGAEGENRQLYLQVVAAMLAHWQASADRQVQAIFPVNVRDEIAAHLQ